MSNENIDLAIANISFDQNDYKQAIVYFLRVDVNTLSEAEKWCYYCRMGKYYKSIGSLVKAIEYLNLAISLSSTRIEAHYELLLIYQNQQNHAEAWKLFTLASPTLDSYRSGDLNLSDLAYPVPDKNIYSHLFYYHASLSAYYAGEKDISRMLTHIFNSDAPSNLKTSTLHNFKFYARIPIAQKRIDLSETFNCLIDDIPQTFTSSTGSIIPYKNGYLLNIRFVSYKLTDNYTKYTAPGTIHNYNKLCILDSDFKVVSFKLFTTDYDESDKYEKGVQDIKLYQNTGRIEYYGTIVKQVNPTVIGMVTGEYSPDYKFLPHTDLCIVNSGSTCEKNWIYINPETTIYKWSPLELGSIKDNILSIHTTKQMPRIFEFVRGSSNAFKFNDEYWIMTHLTSYETPRYYYHMIVVLDLEFNLKSYTLPFKFSNECIEYCLGLIVTEETIICSYSILDSKSFIGVFAKETFEQMWL